ncbi:YeeE/YedE thiosulfate transporter family protein [Nitratifractor sp.]|uniref:YeeE/YedE thiosulfate transporter family protein n=1 Tax=Nitratifractor sp. TaxID=2268144 RepID=UPI0025F28F39|nr:YeeE/YedE thiosulfate transporter family protein [Nitratifractor sp.]
MEKKYWNPYFGGVVLGTMLFLSFVIASQGFGASGTFSRATAQFLVDSDKSWLNNAYIAHYFRHGDNALLNWTVIETIGIFLGGFASALLAGRFMIRPDKAKGYSTLKRLFWALIGGMIIAFATRLTRGCTSGQGLDGMATFSVGAWIFMFATFAAALIFSPLFRKQWVDENEGGDE